MRSDKYPVSLRVALVIDTLAGRLSLPKAYPDLIEAFAILHQVYPTVILAIVSGGQLYDELAAVTAKRLFGAPVVVKVLRGGALAIVSRETLAKASGIVRTALTRS